MRVVFFGTPAMACPALVRLASEAKFRPLAVFTQPAARRSRRGTAEPSPVGAAAASLGLPVHEVESVNEGPALEALRALAPEVIVVVAFGQILKRVVLELPVHGCLNFHPSLLPQYRGAAPVQRAVLEGVTDSGLTVMRLVRKLDAGPILLQQPWRMDPAKDAEALLAEAGELGAEMLVHALRGLPALPPQPQNDALATYAPPMDKPDGEIRFGCPAAQVINRIRAVQPWPRATATLLQPGGPRRVLVYGPQAAPGDGAPGTVLRVDAAGIVVACAQGAVCLRELQLEGKPRLPARDVANGLRLKAGAQFEA